MLAFASGDLCGERCLNGELKDGSLSPLGLGVKRWMAAIQAQCKSLDSILGQTRLTVDEIATVQPGSM